MQMRLLPRCDRWAPLCCLHAATHPRPAAIRPLRLPGDYHRYLAEFKTGADRKEAAEHTLLAYKAAQVRVYGAGHA